MVAVMATLVLEYVIRGYHNYMCIWIPEVSERLSPEVEAANPHDRYAVAVASHERGIVGHVPKKISRVCHSFLTRNVAMMKSFQAILRQKLAGCEMLYI